METNKEKVKEAIATSLYNRVILHASSQMDFLLYLIAKWLNNFRLKIKSQFKTINTIAVSLLQKFMKNIFRQNCGYISEKNTFSFTYENFLLYPSFGLKTVSHEAKITVT